MTYEQQQSSSLPSSERATHHTSTRIPEGRCSFAPTLSLALPNPLFPLLVTRRQILKLFREAPHSGIHSKPFGVITSGHREVERVHPLLGDSTLSPGAYCLY